MSLLVLQAYLKAASLSPLIGRGDFSALYERVRKSEGEQGCTHSRPRRANLCAVDMALHLDWKEVLCLQRSAATACLLTLRHSCSDGHRRQQMPFRAHAWVEVDGRVVNDKPYTPEMYACARQVLKRDSENGDTP